MMFFKPPFIVLNSFFYGVPMRVNVLNVDCYKPFLLDGKVCTVMYFNGSTEEMFFKESVDYIDGLLCELFAQVEPDQAGDVLAARKGA